jgi:hypothetical protein
MYPPSLSRRASQISGVRRSATKWVTALTATPAASQPGRTGRCSHQQAPTRNTTVVTDQVVTCFAQCHTAQPRDSAPFNALLASLPTGLHPLITDVVTGEHRRERERRRGRTDQIVVLHDGLLR